MKIVNHSKIDRHKWQEFVDAHCLATIFHTPYMFDVYSDTPNHEPFAYFALDSSGEIQAMLSGAVQTVARGFNTVLTRRAVMMQSPLYIDSSSLKYLLLHYVDAMRKRVVYSEIRNHYDTSLSKPIYNECGFQHEEHLDILVDLSKPMDVLFSEMAATRRKQINRGYKRGVELKIIDDFDEESIGKCHSIVDNLYKRIRLPSPPMEMLSKAFLSNRDNSYAKCFALLFDGEIIGTRMVLCFKDKIYDWFAGASEEHYDKYPNDILPWEVFKWGHNNGFTSFDFGGAGKPGVPYGVRDYKLKFGGSLENYGRYHCVHYPLLMKMATYGFRLLQAIKQILAKIKVN